MLPKFTSDFNELQGTTKVPPQSITHELFRHGSFLVTSCKYCFCLRRTERQRCKRPGRLPGLFVARSACCWFQLACAVRSVSHSYDNFLLRSGGHGRNGCFTDQRCCQLGWYLRGDRVLSVHRLPSQSAKSLAQVW